MTLLHSVLFAATGYNRQANLQESDTVVRLMCATKQKPDYAGITPNVSAGTGRMGQVIQRYCEPGHRSIQK